MKFKFGARMRSGQFTVRPSHSIIDPISKRVEHTKPLRVHFKEHQWDSVVAQKEQNWTDEERIECENYLKNHPDFGRVDGRGIFIDQAIKQLSAEDARQLYQSRDVNAIKEALAGAPKSGVTQMVAQLLEQADALLKMSGIEKADHPVVPAEVRDEVHSRVCIQMREVGDDAIQCTNPALDDGDFCAHCQQEIDDLAAKEKAAKQAPKSKQKDKKPEPAGATT